MSIRESYPLAPLQQGMLFNYLMAPASGADIEQLVVALPEAVDAAALEHAWQQVGERHPIMRTAFRWEGVDQPVQDVHERAPLPFTHHDWRGKSTAEQEDLLTAFLEADRARGFDLRTAPAARLALIRLADEDYRLVWTFHHILMDGRSFRLILVEAFDDYDCREGGAPVARPGSRPYREYIEWIASLDTDRSRAYWQETLAGFSSPTPVPASRVTGGVRSRNGNVATTLDEVSTRKLRDVARTSGLTMNTLVQGAWALVLSRYSGESDVVFGVVRACRTGTVEGADTMIGLFINTLPLRTTVMPERHVDEWLRELRGAWRSLRDHEHTPLVKVQQWVALPHSVPLFNSILMFEEYLLHDWVRARGGAWARRSLIAHEQPGYLITAKAYDGPALTLQLDFDRGRIDQETASRVLGHFRNVLQGMGEGLARPVGTLSLASDEERRLVTETWNATTFEDGPPATVAQLFDEQAANHPDVVAILSGDEETTYEQLAIRANMLAHRLQSMGVGPDVCVGLCLERSTEMMIAVLAVLKAGGAYVPLDPAYPPDRLAYMLENARAPLVVTQRALRERLPATAAQIVVIDEAGSAKLPAHAPRSEATPESLAYVIYTSGSTGQPKGVAMPHRPLVNLLRWQLRHSALARGARTLQFSSLSFDVSFQELFATWLAGGTLVLITEALRRDPAGLLQVIERASVERLFLPFIALQQLGEAADETGRTPVSLREVITAGEQLQVTGPLIRFFERNRQAFLENQYGPTETHVITAYRLTGAPPDWPPLPPIGRPISNARVYVLDSARQPVPIGVPGELYLAGVSVAHGYLHRPELTAERFLPDPFVGGNALMYKAGDIARFLPDGNIEYLGRADSQLKVRGYRVELGEIEAVLSGHPGLRECAVAAPLLAGTRQLVAYFISREGEGVNAEELRTFLARQLPEHMVPGVFVRLPALPLTPSGKVDRRKLPVPTETEAARADQRVEATDVTELQLISIWERLLGRRGIGTSDDFFALGGHSLLAVRMFGQIRKIFGKNLPIVTLFESPTISQLARRLKEANQNVEWESVVTLQPFGTKPPLFLVPGGGGNLLGYRHLVPHLSSDRPSYGFQPPSLQGTCAHFESIEDTAAHYVARLRAIQPEGPYSLQGWCIGGLVAFEMAQQLRAAGEEVQLLVMVDTTFPRATAPSLRERVTYHLRQFRTMPKRAALAYALQRLRDYPVVRYRQLRGAARRASFSLHVKSGSAAPRTLTEDHVLDADWILAKRYRPRPYAGPLILVWSAVKPAEAYVDSRRAWSDVAVGGVRQFTVGGSHHSMFEEPNVREFAALLSDLLEHEPAGVESALVVVRAAAAS